MRVEGDEDTFVSLCRTVWENRRDTCSVRLDRAGFRLDDDRALEMGRALRRNTRVRNLQIPVGHLTLAGTSSLAHVLQFNHKLANVEIVDKLEDIIGSHPSVAPLEEYQRIMAVVDRLLTALALNEGGNLRFLQLPRVFGPLALSSCLSGLRVRTSLTKIFLQLPHSLANSAETTDDAILLGETIASLSSLKILKVDCSSMNWTFLIPFLQGLSRGHNLSLRSLLLWDLPWLHDTEPIAIDIRETLAALPGLECFHLRVNKAVRNPNNDGGVGLILQGLHDHPSLRLLQLAGSRAVNDEVAPQLARLLLHNQRIQCLPIDCARLVDLCDIAAVLETNTSLQKLQVVIQHRETEMAKFEESCQRLGALLPRIANLKEFELLFEGLSRCQRREPLKDIPPDLLRGFEHNTSLTWTEVKPRVDDQTPDLALNYYGTRNYFGPELAAASKAELPSVLENIWKKREDIQSTELSCLSLVYETLRERGDWIDPEASRVYLPTWIDGMFHC